MREIIDLTKKLIRFKSMPSKPQEIKDCIGFIEKYLLDCKAEYRLFNHHKTPSIQVVPSSGFVPILLMTHIDVVEAPGEDAPVLQRKQRGDMAVLERPPGRLPGRSRAGALERRDAADGRNQQARRRRVVLEAVGAVGG